MSADTKEEPTLFGHPTALFGLFFAEMWERFSYYGMRALLVLYMLKGFLEYGDDEAYKVYGAYAAMVYMTPFFGGMLADRLLGRRRAVILGGLLMAAGHAVMMIEAEMPFYIALAMLIVGNGFFKPNISSMVGGLYKDGDPRRDGGFTIFYIGINLGAAIAPLLCGYVGETYGWHYGFGLATVGMLVGLAVFVVPGKLARWLILSTALATAFGQVVVQDNWLLLAINAYVAIALVISGVAAFLALGRGGIDSEMGAPPDMALLKKPIMGIPLELVVYLGSFALVPFFAVLVWSNRAITLVPHSVTDPLMAGGKLSILAGTLLHEMSTPAGLLLMVIGSACFLYVFYESMQSAKIERQRLWVALVMMAFSALFWAFFEQAGTSVNNFTDRNVDRVMEDSVVDNSQVGSTLTFRVMPIPSKAAAAAVPGLADMPLLDQEQLGYNLKGKPFTMDQITSMRKTADFKGKSDEKLNVAAQTVEWPVKEAHVGMGIGGTIIPASTFQSANAIFIITFGLLFSMLWTALGKRGIEPNTPVKFVLGLLQLGLGFGFMWWGATQCDPRGMVGMSWLLLGYLAHTTGELCLSPVGLSMVTKLSPKKLVSTVMGAWFLATAFSSYVAAVIATFTSVSDASGGNGIPVPLETVHVYGSVFGTIGIASCIAAGLLLVLSPILAKWMHDADGGSGGDDHSLHAQSSAEVPH